MTDNQFTTSETWKEEKVRFLALITDIQALLAKHKALFDLDVQLPLPVAAAPAPQTLATFKAMLQRGDYVVLDTETTSLDDGEICQIAIVHCDGGVLLDTLIKPVRGIPASATAIHQITNEMVADAPSFADIVPQIVRLLNDRDVVVWNATYDRKMLHKSAEAAKLPKTDWKSFSRWWCAMEAFAEVYGDWNEYRGNYRWQKLVTATNYYDMPVNGAHSALGDARMTLAVCRKMVE